MGQELAAERRFGQVDAAAAPRRRPVREREGGVAELDGVAAGFDEVAAGDVGALPVDPGLDPVDDGPHLALDARRDGPRAREGLRDVVARQAVVPAEVEPEARAAAALQVRRRVGVAVALERLQARGDGGVR